MRCASFYFERDCPEQRPRGAGGAALAAPKQARAGAAQSALLEAGEKKRLPRATPAVTPARDSQDPAGGSPHMQ
jgi:hypothetical protein